MLVGKETAIIPIGLSCQPASQLHRLQAEFSRAVGEELTFEASFLNWVICTCEGVAQFFERLSFERVTAERIAVDRRLELIGAGIWIWHEQDDDWQAFSREDLERVAAKFEHLRQKMLSMRDFKQRTFVICHADNALTSHYMWADGRMDFRFDRRKLNRIKLAIDKAFPTGSNRLVVIGLRGRLDSVDWAYPTLAFEPDNSVWEGDDAQWERAIDVIAHGGIRLPHLPESWRRPAEKIGALPTTLHFDADDERLKTAVGHREVRTIRLDGAAGGGLYGPYVRLAAGFYEAAIRFESADLAGSGVMDVVGGFTPQVIANRPVRASNISGREARLRVVFERDTINVEVRLWCHEGFVGAIEGVRITRVEV